MMNSQAEIIKIRLRTLFRSQHRWRLAHGGKSHPGIERIIWGLQRRKERLKHPA